MAQADTTNQTLPLAGVALRYPEKTFYLGRVFKDTTNSYKLVWFLAILSLLKRNNVQSLRLADIFTEMAIAAWHPVCLYRLSLGVQDQLQHVILEIQQSSRLAPNAAPEAIRKFVEGSVAAHAKLDFKRFVPTRFVAPWFEDELRGMKDSLKDNKIKALTNESQASPFACPYYFEGRGAREAIRLNESWRMFLLENLGIIQSFTEHHLALYLQARNPNVPGVVNKLRAPTGRQLTAARDFWRLVRTDFDRGGRSAEFRDIYSERQLGDNFTIDHFLPWSFVVHDLHWNLTPVEPATNSSKSDSLPDLDVYLPRLAKLHFGAIKAAKKHPKLKLLEHYTDCFKQDPDRLVALGEPGLLAKYREIMVPQAQIAINLGFQPGWKQSSFRAEPQLVTDIKPSVIPVGPEPAEQISMESVIVPFPQVGERESSPDYLPYYSLKVAAGAFIAGDAPQPEGWVNVARLGFKKRTAKGMFVSRVVGKSMEPTILDGALCVFRSPVEGSRQGRIVLVQRREISDPETGGNFTVKRYRSTKTHDETGWRHELIELIPDNPDRRKYPVMRFTPKDEGDLRVIAEFVVMLDWGSATENAAGIE
ncbi:MAG: hypothetical protein HY735_19080 [Verrucomicrobia bacterium]|nr:hypothetical protein [Verrucomicrobiota bacterium]